MNITMLKNVKHKGTKYPLGSTLDLSEPLVTEWLKAGYVALAETEAVVERPRSTRRPTRGGEANDLHT